MHMRPGGRAGHAHYASSTATAYCWPVGEEHFSRAISRHPTKFSRFQALVSIFSKKCLLLTGCHVDHTRWSWRGFKVFRVLCFVGCTKNHNQCSSAVKWVPHWLNWVWLGASHNVSQEQRSWQLDWVFVFVYLCMCDLVRLIMYFRNSDPDS